MQLPKLFVGSSQKNLKVAQLLADGLEEAAEVTIWNEGVFGLNQGFLETLLKKLEEFDFAALVLAADDLTTAKDETRPSPRDNVLFESGLFMGVLGRERVFLVCDDSVPLKIPSDLAGVTLASYDGERLASTSPDAAVRKAARLTASASPPPAFRTCWANGGLDTHTPSRTEPRWSTRSWRSGRRVMASPW
jgi:predicted nucleotide-binding protein